jgi:hypothetical protein
VAWVRHHKVVLLIVGWVPTIVLLPGDWITVGGTLAEEDGFIRLVLGLAGLFAIVTVTGHLPDLIEPFRDSRPDVTPRILAGEPDDKLIEGIGTRHIDRKEKWVSYRLVAIPFANVARRGHPSSIATNVVATIKVLNEKGAVLDRAHGRWRELVSPGQPQEAPPTVGVEQERSITMAPDGRRHFLDVIAQDYTYLPRTQPSEGCLLVRDPLSAIWLPVHRLEPGTYRLDIALRGNNVQGQVMFSYDLLVPGDPADPRETEERPVLRQRPR